MRPNQGKVSQSTHVRESEHWKPRGFACAWTPMDMLRKLWLHDSKQHKRRRLHMWHKHRTRAIYRPDKQTAQTKLSHVVTKQFSMKLRDCNVGVGVGMNMCAFNIQEGETAK